VAAQKLPVAVIGAGPVGLAAAAHLLERGETPIVFEASDRIGARVRAWGHVRMFSPWEFNVDGATVRRLKAHGWQMPPKDDLPTGDELVDQYLQPFAALLGVREHIHLDARVTAITRRDIDKMKDAGREDAPFVVHVECSDGKEMQFEARAVIDASGTWTQPNPLGANGLPAAGEKRHADRLFYGIPDVRKTEHAHYAGKRVMVVGSGHSAINALLLLAELKETYPDTQIVWAMRGKALAKVYGGGTSDELSARGRLATRTQALVDAGVIEIASPFRIERLESSASGVRVIGRTNDGTETREVDEIVVTTGARPQLDMLRELRLDLDSSLETTRTLAPMIDPNIHSCGTVRPHGEAELRQPERDFYIVGMKSYGRAPTFLLATGYEQVRSVVAALAGDWEAARDVQLCLPETGVCSTDFDGDGGSCCAAPAAQTATITFGEISLSEITVSPIALQASPIVPLTLEPVLVDSTDAGACCAPGCCS
jgi:thioredoxin reductase